MEATGAQVHLDKLMEANNRFIQLEAECRGIVSARTQVNMADIRKQSDAVYRSITDAINVFIKLNGEERYKSLVADINTLVDKYEALLAQRKGRAKKQESTSDDDSTENE
jgi:metal-dependent amidase/aminoacylase/carboxypeptidase family protein